MGRLTAYARSLWSRAMQKDIPGEEPSADGEERPDEALKKPPRPSKGGRESKEARLAAALRENLRRRKAAARKEKETE